VRYDTCVRAAALITVVWVLALAALHAQDHLRSRIYASGFTLPLAFVQDPTDRTIQFVVEQGGRIRVVRGGVVLSRDFLDLTGAVLSGGERGF